MGALEDLEQLQSQHAVVDELRDEDPERALVALVDTLREEHAAQRRAFNACTVGGDADQALLDAADDSATVEAALTADPDAAQRILEDLRPVRDHLRRTWDAFEERHEEILSELDQLIANCDDAMGDLGSGDGFDEAASLQGDLEHIRRLYERGDDERGIPAGHLALDHAIFTPATDGRSPLDKMRYVANADILDGLVCGLENNRTWEGRWPSVSFARMAALTSQLTADVDEHLAALRRLADEDRGA